MVHNFLWPIFVFFYVDSDTETELIKEIVEHCYKLRCEVCHDWRSFISADSSRIGYVEHPFWQQYYCHSHEGDGTFTAHRGKYDVFLVSGVKPVELLQTIYAKRLKDREINVSGTINLKEAQIFLQCSRMESKNQGLQSLFFRRITLPPPGVCKNFQKLLNK